uniref:Uncharacterized protein n=1 Tax=uncultured marine virus TaxID=186617 RepID=A0A0F7L9P8_9VIRU|nr:hypothetical protein [uncultured marine virus]
MLFPVFLLGRRHCGFIYSAIYYFFNLPFGSIVGVHLITVLDLLHYLIPQHLREFVY